MEHLLGHSIIIACLMIFGSSTAQEDLIVNVLPGEMPHHISVSAQTSDFGYYENSANGIILDETHILTVTPLDKVEDLSIVSGITNLLNIYIGLGKRHTIKSVTQHPDYAVCYDPRQPNSNTPRLNNVFIIEVEEPFDFRTATRKPARLPQANFTIPASGVVASWIGSGLSDDALKKTTIQILNNTHCEDFYGKYKITENMFCGAFLDEAGESYNVIDRWDMGAVISCREDPDDPESPKVICGLMEKTKYLNYLCQEPSGTTELGKSVSQYKPDCNLLQGKTISINYPVVFIKVSKYLDWINETLAQNKK